MKYTPNPDIERPVIKYEASIVLTINKNSIEKIYNNIDEILSFYIDIIKSRDNFTTIEPPISFNILNIQGQQAFINFLSNNYKDLNIEYLQLIKFVYITVQLYQFLNEKSILKKMI